MSLSISRVLQPRLMVTWMKFIESNVVGTGNLFAALSAKKADPRLIVVASSAQVYDAAEREWAIN